MMEKTVIENITLYLGDAKQILPALVAEGLRAKCCVTDPPYLLTSGGPNGVMCGAFDSSRYDNGGHLVACDIDWKEIMCLVWDCLAEQSHAYVMANNRNVLPMLRAAEQDAGFGFHNLLVWDKVTGTPNRWYMKNGEFTGFFYKGKAYEINDCGSMSVIRYQHTDVSKHPTEKPVSLMEYYIRNSTDVGELVIDMFMGSGSTGVAAARAGRAFVGIEMDPAHYKTAVDRITEEVQRGQTFMF